MNRIKPRAKRVLHPRAGGSGYGEHFSRSRTAFTAAEIEALARHPHSNIPLPLSVIQKAAHNHKIPLDWIIARLRERGIRVGHA